LFGEQKSIPEAFVKFDADLTQERRITERLIEFNLGAYLTERGLNIKYNKFGVTATKPDFRIEDIGFCTEVGIEFKSYYLHYRHQHGITLDWKVMQYFGKTLDVLPSSMDSSFMGLPVILKHEDGGLSQIDLKEYEGRYLGVITNLGRTQVEVLCRDGQKRIISKKELLPEAKSDVVSRLAGFSKEQKGTDSIQRRVMTLAHSLTPAGRRNLKILQDKLRSAIDFLNPDNRPAITVNFVPYSVGKMKVSASPGTAKVERA
jgi:hypothetical protein